MHIGLKIKELLAIKKLNAPMLAKSIGKTKQSVYGYLDKPDIDTGILRNIANALEVPLSYFFEEDGNSKKIIGDNNIIGQGSISKNSNNISAKNDELLKAKDIIIKNLENEIQECKKVKGFYGLVIDNLFLNVSKLYVDIIKQNSELQGLLSEHKTTNRLLAQLNTFKAFSGIDVELDEEFYNYIENPY